MASSRSKQPNQESNGSIQFVLVPTLDDDTHEEYRWFKLLDEYEIEIMS